MRPVESWWKEIDGRRRRWLILGKGPTFERRGDYELTPFVTLAINHVVRELKVDVVSAVNFEVVGDCSEDIDQNSRFLLMPRYPHTIPGDAPLPLEAYFPRYPILEKLSGEGRLIWYNLSSDTIDPASRIIENGPFSVCILFNLLGAMGAHSIKTLGIDGGQAYGGSFADMENRTRLANGMESYDPQFEYLIKTVERYGMDWKPLGDSNPSLRRQIALLLRVRFRRQPKAWVRAWKARVGFWGLGRRSLPFSR